MIARAYNDVSVGTSHEWMGPVVCMSVNVAV